MRRGTVRVAAERLAPPVGRYANASFGEVKRSCRLLAAAKGYTSRKTSHLFPGAIMIDFATPTMTAPATRRLPRPPPSPNLNASRCAGRGCTT